MPLSKARMRERKRLDRKLVKPASNLVQPDTQFRPNKYASKWILKSDSLS